MILDGVKDHVLCHVTSRGTAKEMWDALAMLYQGSFEKRKMYLEQKLRFAQMQKGERVDTFLAKLKETRDESSTTEHTPQDSKLVRLALNFVSNEWQVFVQSILGRAALPNWDNMWAALNKRS